MTDTATAIDTSPETAEFEDSHYDQPQIAEFDLTVLGQGAWLMAKILVPLLVGCFVVTLIYFTAKLAIVATFVVFMLSVFIAIPLFLACLEDEIIEADDH